MFDWDDGTRMEWIGPFNSGQTVTVSHTWRDQGSYAIKVKAKDIYGGESFWSDPLAISIPKKRNLNPEAYLWFTSGIFKFTDEDEDYIYEEAVKASFIGFGPGFYHYGLSNRIPIKIMKPFFGIMSKGSIPFFGIGVCRHWDYDVK
jgi:hypothetical protein